MKKINFDALDAIRGIAAFYVCINHSRGNFFEGISRIIETYPQSDWTLFDKIYFSLTQLTILGHEFVILFFILSGFSIAHSVLKSNNILGFYKRRLIRLYPPYLAGIIWAYLTMFSISTFIPEWMDCNSGIQISSLICKVDMFEPLTIVKNLFYLVNGFILAPYWSLIYEIIFYLLIPIFIKKPKFYIVSSIILFLIHIGLFGIKYDESFQVLGGFFLHYNFYFAIGVAVYLYRDLVFKKMNWLTLKLDSILAFGLFMFCVLLKIFLGSFQIITELVALVLSVQLMRIFLLHSIHIKILSYLGKISYTLYVTHFATIFFVKFVSNKIWGYDGDFIENYYVWILIPLICVAVAHIFYIIAEEPSKKVLVKMRNKV